MLVTISTDMHNAADLGYLLHKHPDRMQSVALSFGTATVAYPESGPGRCTAALAVEIEAGDRAARGRERGTADTGIVSDRSWAGPSGRSRYIRPGVSRIGIPAPPAEAVQDRQAGRRPATARGAPAGDGQREALLRRRLGSG